MKNFWAELPKPFTALAPLDGVTDVVFRQMITKLGKPDVLFTEFTSCEGLQSGGFERVKTNLLFHPNEQPVVAQIWGHIPENYYETAKYLKELGFAGVDINMGCPIRSIIKDGGCSALIKNPDLAKKIIQATKDGAGDLPVSVKTRIGFHRENIEEWIGFLLQQDLAVLTVHLRTVSELSKVPAHWDLMSKVIELRNKIAPKTIIIGNGDITTREEIQKKFDQYKCDGFMIGRGIFANPWLFNEKIDMVDISINQRFDTFLEHIKLYEKTWGVEKTFEPLKKFCKVYINNFSDAAHYREKIMQTTSLKELEECVLSAKSDFQEN